MRTLNVSAAILAALSLAACTTKQGPTVYVDLSATQQQSTDTSAIAAACSGRNAGVHLVGDSLLNLDVSIDSLGPDNAVISHFGHTAVPVDYFDQSLVRPVYEKNAMAASCHGLALKANIRHDYEGAGKTFLEYVIEIAPQQTGGLQTVPTKAYRYHGTIEVHEGLAEQNVRLQAGEHALSATFSVTPGPAYRRHEIEKKARQSSHSVQNQYASPMADEEPNRTLEDMTNPGYQSSSSNSNIRLQADPR